MTTSKGRKGKGEERKGGITGAERQGVGKGCIMAVRGMDTRQITMLHNVDHDTLK